MRELVVEEHGRGRAGNIELCRKQLCGKRRCRQGTDFGCTKAKDPHLASVDLHKTAPLEKRIAVLYLISRPDGGA